MIGYYESGKNVIRWWWWWCSGPTYILSQYLHERACKKHEKCRRCGHLWLTLTLRASDNTAAIHTQQLCHSIVLASGHLITFSWNSEVCHRYITMSWELLTSCTWSTYSTVSPFYNLNCIQQPYCGTHQIKILSKCHNMLWHSLLHTWQEAKNRNGWKRKQASSLFIHIWSESRVVNKSRNWRLLNSSYVITLFYIKEKHYKEVLIDQ
jgi:hypothetical protein